ncbi:MAG: guanylate kinase [Planctomycetes bacterium]|nr:guanylate kinase [Planctomycetota bacterium]
MYPAHGPAARFLVISGPSGAGKSTIIQGLCARLPGLVRCLSCTTRAARGQERDGVDYFFLSAEEFARRTAAGAFLEHATVFGKHSYGTPRAFVEEQLAAGRSVIKDVDVQGGAQIRRSFPAALQVFVAPSSRGEIERRLRHRGTDSEEVIARRLAEADAELARWQDYDHLVINDQLEQAIDDVAAILRAAALRIQR